MKLDDLKKSGHWPTLLTAFLYFDVSFMVWTVLGPLGAQVGKSLALSPEQKGVMVAFPILAGAVLRIVLGFAVDRFGAKRTGIVAQLIVAAGLAVAWQVGLPTYFSTLMLGVVLGFAGASFAVALPLARASEAATRPVIKATNASVSAASLIAGLGAVPGQALTTVLFTSTVNGSPPMTSS